MIVFLERSHSELSKYEEPYSGSGILDAYTCARDEFAEVTSTAEAENDTYADTHTRLPSFASGARPLCEKERRKGKEEGKSNCSSSLSNALNRHDGECGPADERLELTS